MRPWMPSAGIKELYSKVQYYHYHPLDCVERVGGAMRDPHSGSRSEVENWS